MSTESIANPVTDVRKEEIMKLKTEAKDLAGWEALFNAQKAAVAEQNAVLKQVEQKRETTGKNVTEAKRKIVELQQKIMEAAAANERERASGLSLPRHVENCAALQRELVLRKEVFSSVQSLVKAGSDASAGVSNLKVVTIPEALTLHEDWPRFDSALDTAVKQLQEIDTKFRAAGADVAPAGHLKELVAEVRALYNDVAGPLARESSRRKNFDANLRELKQSQARIVMWCRQQRSTMEALVDPEHIQEFTNSFQSNITVMDTNFLVLMELAEPLLPNAEVQQLLQEATSVWLGLEVFAFEKLNATILSQHTASRLEEETSKWCSNSPSVKDFLLSAQHVLDMPTDEESQKLTEPVKNQLRELLEDWDAFGIITSHLTDFTAREQSLKEYYEAIRRTVFSKLTLLTQVYNGQYNFERKPEYMDRLAELTDWVACKSHSDAWMQLQERVDKMKMLIEENEALHGTTEERGY